MNIIDLVAMGLLKETQDGMRAITKEETPDLAGRVYIACWSSLTEETREFWREKAGNLPVGKERDCDICGGTKLRRQSHKSIDAGLPDPRIPCGVCYGTGKLPTKTLKQLLEGEEHNGLR